jgi:hypothetical protein
MSKLLSKVSLITVYLILGVLKINAQDNLLISENDTLALYETYISSTSKDNIFPTRYKNGLLYSSANGSNFYQILYSNLKSKSVKIKLPKKHQSGAFSTFKNEIYVTSTTRFVDSFGVFNLAIYKGIIEDFKVKDLKILPICNTNFSYQDPTISKDGNTMVVVTNEKGQYHLLELKRNATNQWEKVGVIFIIHPAFKIINPSIYNNNTIYFSSNITAKKLKSLTYKKVEDTIKVVDKEYYAGPFNIYKVERKKGIWQLPVKVDELNSNFDELGVIFETKKSGFLTTFRFSNTDNIYYFKLKQ